jgi:hypothetical protein
MLGAYLLVRRGALQTTVQRHCPTELMEGETVDAQVAVATRARWGLLWVQAEETASAGLAVEPLPTEQDSPFTGVAHYRLTALRRGAQRLGPVYLTLSDPFGLFVRQERVDATTEVLVLPRPDGVAPLELGRRRARAADCLYDARQARRGHRLARRAPLHPRRPAAPYPLARHRPTRELACEGVRGEPTCADRAGAGASPTWRADDEAYPDFDQAIRHLAWIILEAPRQGVSVILVGSGMPEVRLTPESYTDPRGLLRLLARLQPDADHSILDDLPRLIQQYGERYRIALFVPPQEYACSTRACRAIRRRATR